MRLSSRTALAAASTTLVVLLAACGGGTTDDGAADAGNPAATPAEPAPGPAPDGATPPADDGGDSDAGTGDDVSGTTIPARWHGNWAGNEAGCREPAGHIEGLAISANELRFHESVAVPRRVEAVDADSIRVESDYEGEGQQWSATQVLRLSNGDATLQVDGPDGISMTRVRCEGAA